MYSLALIIFVVSEKKAFEPIQALESLWVISNYALITVHYD
jgi:hypothetical protein